MQGRRQYRIISIAGQGGFGTVYCAQMIDVGGFTRLVALKLLHDNLERRDELIARQRDEARLMGLLNHPVMVTAYGMVRLPQGWATVMELLNGIPVDELLERGPLPPKVVLTIIAEIASALQHAWSQPGLDGEPLRLIHRDIKPSNIVLTPEGAIKLLDFGAARADFSTREAKTKSMMLGTIRYIAPERFAGNDTPVGDVYSLGISAAEMLLGGTLQGSLPSDVGINPSSVCQRLEAHLAQKAPLLTPEEREQLPRLIREMMSFDPDNRPSPRDVEVRCRALLQTLPGETMRAWASMRLVPLVEERERSRETDPLCGHILEEIPEDSARTPPPPPPRAAPSQKVLLGAGVLAGVMLPAAALLGAGLVLLVMWSQHEEPPPPEPIAVAEPEPTVEPEPVPEPEPVAEPEPEPVVVARSTPPPEPQPVVEPEPAPPPEPEPTPAPAGGTVSITGDRPSYIDFRGPGGKLTPGDRFTPGSYTVWASFDDAPADMAGTVSISDGTNSIKCKASAKRCMRL